MKISRVKQWTPLVLRRDIKRVSEDAEFIIHEPFSFGYSVEGEPRREFTVPEGFITDLSSVPRIFRWLVSKTDLIEASVAHDFLYAGDNDRPVVPKAEADLVFLAFAASAKDKFIQRNIAYFAVKMFGGPAYNT